MYMESCSGCLIKLLLPHVLVKEVIFPVDIFGTVVGESPDCLLLSGTVVGENPDYVCWVIGLVSVCLSVRALMQGKYCSKNQFSTGIVPDIIIF